MDTVSYSDKDAVIMKASAIQIHTSLKHKNCKVEVKWTTNIFKISKRKKQFDRFNEKDI